MAEPRVSPWPSSAADYCRQNRAWSASVNTWLAKLKRAIEMCCAVRLGAVPTDLPSDACADWPNAWGELHDYAAGIRTWLRSAGDEFGNCKAVTIASGLPKPRGRALPPRGRANAHACVRARSYFDDFYVWGWEFYELVDSHCEHHTIDSSPDSLVTHLRPPPDPPF